MQRYRQAFIDLAGLSESEADECAEASTFEEVSRYYEGDPEGAAVEEMSYWEAG